MKECSRLMCSATLEAVEEMDNVFTETLNINGNIYSVFLLQQKVHDKRKSFNQCILPAVTYESEKWTSTKFLGRKLKCVQQE